MNKQLERLASGACDALQRMITDAVLAEFNDNTLAEVSADVARELLAGSAGELADDVESLGVNGARLKWLNEVRYSVADAIAGLGSRIDVQTDAEVLEYMATVKDAVRVIREFEALVVADATSDQNLTEAEGVVDQAIDLVVRRAA